MANPPPKRRRAGPRHRKRLLTPARRRAICQRLVGSVVILQAVLLLTLAATPTDPPGGPRLLELLWAWMHKPTFYPLIALVVGGPALSWIAWKTPGKHRTTLVLAWLIFGVILTNTFGERVTVMIRVLWWWVSP